MGSKLLDINKIDPAGTDVLHECGPVSTPEEQPDAPRLIAGRLEGRVERSPGGAQLQARVSARVSVACGRCLEPVEVPIDQRLKLDLRLRPAEAPIAGEVRVDAGDTREFAATEGKVDLQEVLLEQVYLHIPLKTLCAEDCLGLCSACGENRNRLECDCSTVEPDPRLSPLADLKRRMEGS